MMTHIFEDNKGSRIVAAKGAVEALINCCNLNSAEKKQIEIAIKNLSSDGYRILGIGKTEFVGNDFPKKQQEFSFDFIGLM